MSKNVTISFNDELLAILRIRADESKQPFATYVQSLLWSVVRGEPMQSSNTSTVVASQSKEQTVKQLRDALKSIKKVSPIKTELVELLSSFLKDGPAVDHSQTTIVPMSEPVLDEEAEREMDDFLEQRRQANVGRAGGMQPISSAGSMFAPGGALERAANRGGVDLNEFREMFKTSKPNETPEPADDDDWYPDE